MDGRYIFLTDFSVPNPHTKGLRNIMKTFEIIHGYIYTFKEKYSVFEQSQLYYWNLKSNGL